MPWAVFRDATSEHDIPSAETKATRAEESLEMLPGSPRKEATNRCFVVLFKDARALPFPTVPRGQQSPKSRRRCAERWQVFCVCVLI